MKNSRDVIYGRSLGYNKNSERKVISDCSGVLCLNWKRSQRTLPYGHLLLNVRTTYFSYEGQEFAKFLRSVEQFIQTMKGEKNFW
jgi:hypothetical protein